MFLNLRASLSESMIACGMGPLLWAGMSPVVQIGQRRCRSDGRERKSGGAVDPDGRPILDMENSTLENSGTGNSCIADAALHQRPIATSSNSIPVMSDTVLPTNAKTSTDAPANDTNNAPEAGAAPHADKAPDLSVDAKLGSETATAAKLTTAIMSEKSYLKPEEAGKSLIDGPALSSPLLKLPESSGTNGLDNSSNAHVESTGSSCLKSEVPTTDGTDESGSSNSSSDSSTDSDDESLKPCDKTQVIVRKRLAESKQAEEVDAASDVPILSKNEVSAENVKVEPIAVRITDMDVLHPAGAIHFVMKMQKAVTVNTVAPGAKPRPVYSIDEIWKASALNTDSLLCFEDRSPLGRVAETLGPVDGPMYLVRFNSEDEMDAISQLKAGTPVFYVEKHSQFVTGKQIHQKGYDSSNMHDEESNAVEYSDDEDERAARKRKAALRMSNGEGDEKRPTKQLRSDRPRRARRGAGAPSGPNRSSLGEGSFVQDGAMYRASHGNHHGRGGHYSRGRGGRHGALQQYRSAPLHYGAMMAPGMMMQPAAMPVMHPYQMHPGMQPQAPVPNMGAQGMVGQNYGQGYHAPAYPQQYPGQHPMFPQPLYPQHSQQYAPMYPPTQSAAPSSVPVPLHTQTAAPHSAGSYQSAPYAGANGHYQQPAPPGHLRPQFPEQGFPPPPPPEY